MGTQKKTKKKLTTEKTTLLINLCIDCNHSRNYISAIDFYSKVICNTCGNATQQLGKIPNFTLHNDK